MSKRRTPFGQRLLDSRRSAGLSQEEAAAALQIRQSTISELERDGHGSAHTVAFAALHGVSPEWLATGQRLTSEDSRDGANTQKAQPSRGLRGAPAPMVPHTEQFARAPVIAWSQLLPMTAPVRFAVRCPDDSMSPFLRPGAVVHLQRNVPAKPGDIVLVEDSHGRFYLRLYRPRTSTAWEGKPLNDLYQSLDAEREGLKVAAVFVGMEGRMSE